MAKPKASDKYLTFVRDVAGLIESSRQYTARSVNAVMTATYWEVGRRIVQHEQGGVRRAEYGAGLISKLARDLSARFGRGFGEVNLSQMKRFYLTWPRILQTASEKSAGRNLQTLSEKSTPALEHVGGRFPLP